MINKEELVQLMVRKLQFYDKRTETSVCELINEICHPSEIDFSIDELFEIDGMFRKEAMEAGYFLDSMKYDLNPGLPFDTRFVVRRM